MVSDAYGAFDPMPVPIGAAIGDGIEHGSELDRVEAPTPQIDNDNDRAHRNAAVNSCDSGCSKATKSSTTSDASFTGTPPTSTHA